MCVSSHFMSRHTYDHECNCIQVRYCTYKYPGSERNKVPVQSEFDSSRDVGPGPEVASTVLLFGFGWSRPGEWRP